MKKQLVKWSFLMAAGELVYIFLVALFMQNGEKIFAGKPGILPNIAFLLLFVFSAAFSGAMVLGKPVLLYLEGKKKEAVTLFGYTLGWFMLFLVIVLIFSVIQK